MKRYTFFILLLFAIPVLGFAQGKTSSAIEGTVIDAQGEPLPGANVVAIHQPTGTRYGTVSRANGRYTFKNVRVGGPYQMQVTFVGYNAVKKEIIKIELGETVDLNFSLEEGEMSLDEISIIGHADQVFNANRTGARTNISQQDIEETPTVSRSLSDFTRLNPQVTSGYSFGGANDRYNNILVDGATLNDVFGLGQGIPGSQADVQSPISIDAIQEFNVDIAPFGVTNNGFTGGQVNAITKSGTNEFHGSAYYQLRNESLVGTYKFKRDGEYVKSGDYPDFDEHFLGLSIGGPIIKDKLFFFVNGEFRRRNDPLTVGLAGSGAANVFPASVDTLNLIKDVTQNQYGYDPGGYGLVSQDKNNNKLLAKLDWNIDDNNKFTLRYNHVDAINETGLNRSQSTYSYTNGQYEFNDSQNSFVAQLKSTLSDKVFNEIRAVYTRIRDSRKVQNQPFPYVDIALGDRPLDVYLGTEQYSQANSLDQDLIEFTDNLTYVYGDHEFTFGTSNQIFKFDNLFVRNAFGYYQFSDINSYRNGDPSHYEYSYLLPNGEPTAKFTGIQLGFYMQDKVSINDYLTVTYGLRADIPILPDSPTYNSQVSQSFPGYSTSKVASGEILWSPRFGFNWDLSQGNRTTQIRGGAGIFSGNPPFVWISNQYANTGKDYGRISLYGDDIPSGLQFSPNPDSQPSPLDPGSSLAGVNTTEVNLITDDFKYPQSLKFDLAVDQELPYGFRGTLEGIYSDVINDVTFQNINLEQVGSTAYGRPLYGEPSSNSGSPAYIDDDNFTDVILMGNTNKGYQASLTGKIEKRFNFGLKASVSYTYNRAETVNNGSSSQARSNWIYNENVDVNNPQLGPSDYERRHRILGQLSYHVAYADRFATTISIIYDGRSGTPYSWIYYGDANGDGSNSNDLVYVPASQDEVVMESNNWNEFNKFISDHESLDKYRGDFVPRGSAREPWSHFLDLRINQEIGTISGQKFEITASMFNVLNFFNTEWGVRKYVDYNSASAVNFSGYDDGGRPILNFKPQFETKDALLNTNDLSSRWQLQVGVRYSF